jgi:hypothetical protein
MRGPTTLESPYEAPMNPVYAGRFVGVAANAIMVNDPEKTPAPPMPAKARPTIRVGLSFATAG